MLHSTNRGIIHTHLTGMCSGNDLQSDHMKYQPKNKMINSRIKERRKISYPTWCRYVTQVLSTSVSRLLHRGSDGCHGCCDCYAYEIMKMKQICITIPSEARSEKKEWQGKKDWPAEVLQVRLATGQAKYLPMPCAFKHETSWKNIMVQPIP